MKTVEWILDHCVSDDELRQEAYAELEFFKTQHDNLVFSLTKESERLATKVAELQKEIEDLTDARVPQGHWRK